MCGIAGIIGPNHDHIVRRMTEALFHRGPDESGHYSDEHIAIGQRRLSIIDLNSGRQPIPNEDGTIQLICNGEIYNSPELRQRLVAAGHRFKTKTDVEVILHLYENQGPDCAQELRGMFAFALWDQKRKKLVLGRDHMGQKPLFYYQKNGVFMFASEIKAILAARQFNPEIDLDGLWHYISMRYLPDTYTLFQDVRKLPAASVATFERGKLQVERYWNLDFRNKLSGSENDIEEDLHTLLRDTVERHLLSDVRVGAFLSGGIDSGTVTAMMADITGDRIPTFSVGVKEQSFNELPFARMVSDKYRLEAHERVVEADLISMVPSMIYHMDEPSDPFGFGVYLVSQVAKEFVKVVLGGDGGDENFAGYDRFLGQRLVDFYCLIPPWIRTGFLRQMIKRIPESYQYKSLAMKASWVDYLSSYDGGERYAQSLGFLRYTPEAKEKLFTPAARQKITDPDSTDKILRYYNADNVDDVIDRMLYTDLMTRIPDHLLVIADRMTMAHSVESRSPLIDYKVVEFAASIPANLKLKGKNLKYILRKVAARYLPPELIHREKQGFGFPLGKWMQHELKPLLLRLLKESRFVAHGIFSAAYLNKMFEEHFSGQADHNYRIWIFLNLELWYRIYFENESIESVAELMKSSQNASV